MRLAFDPSIVFAGRGKVEIPSGFLPDLHFAGHKAWCMGGWSDFDGFSFYLDLKNKFVEYCFLNQATSRADGSPISTIEDRSSVRDVDWLRWSIDVDEKKFSTFCDSYFSPNCIEQEQEEDQSQLGYNLFRIKAPERLYFAQAIECISRVCLAVEKGALSDVVEGTLEAGEALALGTARVEKNMLQFEHVSTLMKLPKAVLSERARVGANMRHAKPGGSHDKRRQIQEAWATGKYSSRDICAEQECAALGMSFATARKALRGTPNPT
ncbi:MAG: hypothetical protein EG825_08380 [Rhodocyclaceae bacterium]|nr:hypothetical protein [Rhodocyclaceae bacterium]